VPNTNQTNFPVLVSGTYSYLAVTGSGGNVTNLNGYDIIFTSDANGTTLLNWETEQYISSSGQVAYWVRIPTLSHTANTVFYLFYGNGTVTTDQSSFQSSTAPVFDTNYKAVYHLPVNSGIVGGADSTSNLNNGTVNGPTGTTGGTGAIGGGAAFVGAAQYITMGNVLDASTSAYTLEAWVNLPAATNQYANILSKRQNTSPFAQYVFGVGSINSSGAAVSGQTFFLFNYSGTKLQSSHTSATFADGNWHHVMATRSAGTLKIYVDGVNQTLVTDMSSTTAVNVTNTGAFNIGWDNGTNYFNGNVDEARVSIGIARSADWDQAEYNSESSPSTFYAMGAETTSTVVRPVFPGPLEMMLWLPRF
jgi:hypothetical protein